MPTISIFYGIPIMMYFYDAGKHHVPHIHAKYQDDEAVSGQEPHRIEPLR